MSCRYDADQGYVRADGELCHERHCYSCGRNHADQLTCAWCVGEARQILRDLGELCDALPEEAEVRGVQSEAMNLLGPACDPEARGHLAASVAAGRVPAHYLDEADDEHHPLIVLGNSQMEWEDVLGHESLSRITVGGALHYLGANLTDMAQNEMITFADDVAAWKRSLGHLRSVLSATEQRVTGAPCLTCSRNLTLDGDMWVCRSCRTMRDQVQYDQMVREAYLREAEWLSGPDCAEAAGVPKGSVKGWASKGMVGKKLIEGRIHYRISDVREHADRVNLARARESV